MFSSRLNWDLPANPLSRLLAQKRASGPEILDLTESNPTRAGFNYPAEHILAALADPRSLCYEPAPAGILAARSSVSGYYGGQVDTGRILLTASTSEAYALFSNCWPIRATRFWFLALPIRCSTSWPPWNRSARSNIRWSIIGPGKSISTPLRAKSHLALAPSWS